MQVAVGSRIVIHGAHVGDAERHGEVLEVRGENGGAPFLIRFDDGSETLLFPGPDLQIEHRGDTPGGG
ncbi:DUF1918 domain-containing protein [Microbacterium esteraromaticum]|uniref:DUF1918 domain-containing protein n=1 Tax=Microbacterium esteraromaticum TaxID=57043 RepID=UPI001C947B77|nr:DUF1918 domain-containing protein [Microbacterium esteraromaticum]MBY6060638.1 DUF1918 domain-containing protein [Microbacterium esteraromaticum]